MLKLASTLCCMEAGDEAREVPREEDAKDARFDACAGTPTPAAAAFTPATVVWCWAAGVRRATTNLSRWYRCALRRQRMAAVAVTTALASEEGDSGRWLCLRALVAVRCGVTVGVVPALADRAC